MAPKHHPTPLSGGDRKALTKELGRARAMTSILASQSADARAKGEALIRTADKLLCASWNEKMWADGGPIDPSPSVDQAINGGFPWLEIECSRCKTKRDVDLAALRHPPTTLVHDLASRLRCSKFAKAGRRPPATLLQLGPRPARPIRRPEMCNLYSMTKNVDAIRRLFGALNSHVGNLPSMPGIFPDYPAPIVRNASEGREIVMARWGMPSSSRALMDATKRRAEKLEVKGKPVPAHDPCR
jgi:hypothetical protein